MKPLRLRVYTGAKRTSYPGWYSHSAWYNLSFWGKLPVKTLMELIGAI